MARKHPEVSFFKVMEDEARDIIDEQRITGFPTFHFFLKQAKIDEMSGANPQALEAKIAEHKTKGAAPAFGGSGVSLGGGAVARSAEDVARARLKAMSGGASTVAAPKPAAAPAPAPAAVSPAKPIAAPAPAPVAAPVHAPAAADHSTDASRALQEAAKARARAGAAKPASFTPNAEHLAMLQDMGIGKERGHRALQATNNSSIDSALDWLAAHQDDAGLDDPLPAATGSVTVVDDDGDISMTGAGGAGVSDAMTAEDDEAIRVANEALNSGQASDAPKKKMSKEEADEFIKKRRAEKAAFEKEQERLREIRRRTDGKQSQELAEDILDIQRKKEAEKIKADKEAKDKERKRLQIELLRDKIERYQNAHGSVPHDLMEQLATLEGFRPAKAEAVATDPRAALKQALAALAGYKAGIGLQAATTLRTLVNNPLANPGEAKFRSVNLENPKIKERVSSLRGGINVLKAAGFARSEDGATMHLPDDDWNEELLKMAVGEIDLALANRAFD